MPSPPSNASPSTVPLKSIIAKSSLASSVPSGATTSLEWAFCSLASSAATCSSVTSATSRAALIPLYSPSFTSGFFVSVASKTKSLPFSSSMTLMSGSVTGTISFSFRASLYAFVMIASLISSLTTSLPRKLSLYGSPGYLLC